MQPLPPAVCRLWRIAAVASGIAATVVAGAAEFGLRRAMDGGLVGSLPPAVLPLAVGLVLGAAGWKIATLRYRHWGFELTDAWVAGRWGVIGRHQATIPRNRVQTMTSESGPIDRFLGLTSVTIHTAGAGAPNLDIPHLDDSTVEWFRHELARGPLSSDRGE